MTAAVFVALWGRNREQSAPQSRTVLARGRSDEGQDSGRNADVGNLNLTALIPAGQQQMPRLLAKKRNGPAGVHGASQNRAGGPVDAAGQINGDHRKPCRIDRRNGGQRLAGDRSIKSGAKQRIDNDMGAGEVGGSRGYRPLPLARRLGGISFDGVPASNDVHGNTVSGPAQPPGRNEAVAAIVARPRHNGDFAARRVARRNGCGYRGAGILHQGSAGNAGRDGATIRLAHFSISEKLEHRFRIPIPALQRRRVLLEIVHDQPN